MSDIHPLFAVVKEPSAEKNAALREPGALNAGALTVRLKKNGAAALNAGPSRLCTANAAHGDTLLAVSARGMMICAAQLQARSKKSVYELSKQEVMMFMNGAGAGAEQIRKLRRGFLAAEDRIRAAARKRFALYAENFSYLLEKGARADITVKECVPQALAAPHKYAEYMMPRIVGAAKERPVLLGEELCAAAETFPESPLKEALLDSVENLLDIVLENSRTEHACALLLLLDQTFGAVFREAADRTSVIPGKDGKPARKGLKRTEKLCALTGFRMKAAQTEDSEEKIKAARDTAAKAYTLAKITGFDINGFGFASSLENVTAIREGERYYKEMFGAAPPPPPKRRQAV